MKYSCPKTLPCVLIGIKRLCAFKFWSNFYSGASQIMKNKRQAEAVGGILLENPQRNRLTILNLSFRGKEQTHHTREPLVAAKIRHTIHIQWVSISWLAEYPKQVDKLQKLYQKDNGGLITLKSFMPSRDRPLIYDELAFTTD